MRLLAGAEEIEQGRAIADEVVVNHDIGQASEETAGIVASYRSTARQGGRTSGDTAGSIDPPSVSEADNPTEGS
jgi:hypothetical protein